MDIISRYGNDIIVLWDCEDSNTDIFLKVGLSLARALCFRQQQEKHDDDNNRFEEHLKVAIPEMQRHVQRLYVMIVYKTKTNHAQTQQHKHRDDIETWTKTIVNNGEKILKRMKVTRKKLNEQVLKLEKLMYNTSSSRVQ